MFPNSEGVITDPLVATNGHVDVFFDDNRPRFIKPAVQRSADSRGENWKRMLVRTMKSWLKDLPLILVKLSPHTGLKRQLRAHAAQSLRTPILGDSTYRLSSKSKMMRDLRSAMTIPKTVFLHSWELTVTRYSPSPFELTIRAPLPVHFLNVLAHARVGMSLPRKKGDFSKDSPAAKLLSIGGKWYGPTQYTQFQKKNKAKPDSRWRRPSKLPASPSLPASSRVEE
ncbi:uncharacterized protein BXZ73DRAFT_103191 [Epithele typhae]|uniref:uncharacterized protein n=1 Tax=Epithele typhae TaxID=378194 RepID=UPI0020084391|nr:uncharacterized protein BXZ73DRAFT_103191 [Epithele typhae]KAH9925658.1 hypothetical protein BXZ73DRAFT_103191 [Epithele typhae]